MKKYHTFLIFQVLICRVLAGALAFHPDDGGIQLPDGFQAVVIADEIGETRQIAVRENGDVYVSLMDPVDMNYCVAMRDEDGDGVMDVIKYFGELDDRVKGLRLYKDWLYVSDSQKVVRFPLEKDRLLPTGPFEVVVSGFPGQRGHRDKIFTFDDSGNLYVEVGAPSNASQKNPRTPGSPGMKPSPQLERQAGIWRFDAEKLGQTQQQDGYHFATGIRNSIAMNWDPVKRRLYVVQHGRDQLHQLWPDYYTVKESAELPAEEFLEVTEGSNFGWPYTYYDHFRGERMLAPEYGGDGKTPAPEGKYKDPIFAFPAHWAPNDLLFYNAAQFPGRYQGGAFIAFHGSWNRAPLPQDGYHVVFLPFDGRKPAGDYEIFADGFKGVDVLDSPGDARYRPTGLTVGPDGSLYITEDQRGRIWRVVHTGDAESSLTASGKKRQLRQRKKLQTKKGTPPGETTEFQISGKKLYEEHCLMCHQAGGGGVPGLQPALTESERLSAKDNEFLIRLMIEGSSFIEDSDYENVMTSFSHLKNQEIATVLNYVKHAFGGEPGDIDPSDVAQMRK